MQAQRSMTEGGELVQHRPYPKNMKALARSMRKGMTKAERKFWYCINQQQTGFKFRRQYVIDGRFIADFICLEKRLIIEIDGGQHCENIQDQIRTQYLEDHNFKVIRFWNDEILSNMDGCYETLMIELVARNPSPYPLPQGEGRSSNHQQE